MVVSRVRPKPPFWFRSDTKNQNSHWSILLANTVTKLLKHILKGYFSHHKRSPRTNLLPNIKVFLVYFWRSLFNFKLLKTYITPRSRKTLENLKILRKKKKKKFRFWKKKFRCGKKRVLVPIMIPKLDLGFGSRYQNLIWVAH